MVAKAGSYRYENLRKKHKLFYIRWGENWLMFAQISSGSEEGPTNALRREHSDSHHAVLRDLAIQAPGSPRYNQSEPTEKSVDLRQSRCRFLFSLALKAMLTMRLLIADSDPMMKALYESYFANKDFQVATASNGLQCIDAIRKQMPDVLVIEHQLPWGGDDGVLECLQQDFPFASPEVVLLTAERVDGKPASENLPPVRAYLRKPFLLRDLSKLIQSC